MIVNVIFRNAKARQAFLDEVNESANSYIEGLGKMDLWVENPDTFHEVRTVFNSSKDVFILHAGSDVPGKDDPRFGF